MADDPARANAAPTLDEPPPPHVVDDRSAHRSAAMGHDPARTNEPAQPGLAHDEAAGREGERAPSPAERGTPEPSGPSNAESVPANVAWRLQLLVAFGFIAPCAVIALSLYFIIKGGPPHAMLPSATLSAAASALSAWPTSDPPRAEAASSEPPDAGSAPSLESPEPAEVAVPGFEDEGNDEEPNPVKRAAPKHFATVQDAATGSCSTDSVDGLSRQIIEQARCLKPNDFVPLPKRPNLAMASHVYPYLELAARDHLLKALDTNSKTTMTINSCLRTVAQQYLVSRWSVTKTCGVQLATAPGESNHEIGTALDVAEAAKWRPALESEDFRWLGTSDRVHFDFKGGVAAPRSATDVLAFQKLWNRNHKDDLIAESGRYDTSTEQRLKKSPPSGFPIAASCGKAALRTR